MSDPTSTVCTFGVLGEAIWSPDMSHRYALGRATTASGTRRAAFIMLNPSTADADRNDPTIRRCIRFAADAGFRHLAIGNAYSYRSTSPRALAEAEDPVRPENDRILADLVTTSEIVILAWGVHCQRRRAWEIWTRLRGIDSKAHALRLTRDGVPGHPLYLPADLRPRPIVMGPVPGRFRWR